MRLRKRGHHFSGNSLYGRDTRPPVRGSRVSAKALAVRSSDLDYRHELYDRHLLESGEELIGCFECGRKFQQLAPHLSRIHHMTGEAYIAKYKIPVGFRFANKRIRESRSAKRLAAIAAGEFIPNRFLHLIADREKAIAQIKSRPRSERQKQRDATLPSLTGRAIEARRIKIIERGERVERICQSCGKTYSTAVGKNTKYCSGSCYAGKRVVAESSKEALRRLAKLSHLRAVQRRTSTCIICGRGFVRARSASGKYCSMKCFQIVNRERLIARNKRVA